MKSKKKVHRLCRYCEADIIPHGIDYPGHNEDESGFWSLNVVPVEYEQFVCPRSPHEFIDAEGNSNKWHVPRNLLEEYLHGS